jgi:hypothetical protein
MLSSYISETQSLLNDNQGQFFQIPILQSLINKSRRRIAAVSGCLRVVPPGTVTIPNQEIYPLAGWNALVQQALPGAQSVLTCRSVTVGIGGKWTLDQNGQWRITNGSWRPVWKRVVWTDFQARFRIYGGTFMGTFSEPGWWCQYGAGPVGKIYLAPIPTIANPIEVDLSCIPFPLLTDNDPEPIPYPWADAVPYWAATLALMNQQRRQDAQAMSALFSSLLPECASVATPLFIPNAYGATLRSA